MARGETIDASQKQVQLDATVGQAPFASSFDNAALHGNILGELGSTIAQTSANALSTKMGYDEGMNPHGDILPPITEADKHYQQSYISQSKNVLSLQINKMMTDATDEMSKAYRLTPDMIHDYQKQISEGIGEVLENAPTVVQHELGTQYASALISSSSQFNRRMIGQQKDEAISRMKVADKNTDSSILENATTGNHNLAKTLYEQKIEQNKRQRETGMMTPLEEQTSNVAAKMSYYSGLSNSRAMEARNAKGDKLGKYLAGLADLKNKPADVSLSEWNTIGNNTLSLMRHMDALQQVDKATIISGLNEKLAEGSLTEQDILNAYQSPSIDRADINSITSKLYAKQTKQSEKDKKINALVENIFDAKTWGENSPQTQDDAYSAVVDSMKKNNPDLGSLEAESTVAASVAGPTKRFLNTVSNLAQSNNLDDVMAASNAYHRVQTASPQNVLGLPENAYNLINAFDTFRQQTPSDPITALAKARNALITRTPEEQKAVDQNWNAYYNKHYSTPENRLSFAKQTLGQNSWFQSNNIQDPVTTSNHITGVLEKYTKLLGGDVDTAKELTKKAMGNVYGDSWVNGRHESAFLSLEKMSNLGEGSTFFIQRDIVNQVQKGFGQYRQAYDRGDSDFYYRVKDADKWSIESVKETFKRQASIKSRLSAIDEEMKAFSNQSYAEGISTDSRYQALLHEQQKLIMDSKEDQSSLKSISNFKDAIQIEKVYRHPSDSSLDGMIQSFKLSVIPETNTTLSYDTSQPVIGNYFYKFVGPKGHLETLDTINGYGASPIYYTPNFGAIKQEYAGFHNAFGNQPNAKDALQSYIEQMEIKRGRK